MVFGVHTSELAGFTVRRTQIENHLGIVGCRLNRPFKLLQRAVPVILLNVDLSRCEILRLAARQDDQLHGSENQRSDRQSVHLV